MIVLENEGFRVEINPFGAELTSFRSKTTGTEYVWGGDPAAWKRHAPVLFPIVGRLKDKTYTVDGASFEITQHGFGRDLEWEPKQVSGTCAVFTLTQSEYTKKMYPWDFTCTLRFTLDGGSLIKEHITRNDSGSTMYYEIGGHGERKVVLLHGWGCSEKLMAGISDALTPDMTVLRVDFPAHGESGFPPQPWGVPDFAANLLELLTKLDFLPCSVIAHSFGGRVAIELAADHPERFEKLILTGAAGIRPKLSSEKSKKSQRYQRLKKLVGVAKKTHLFGSLPDKWQENLVQKYGSRDYAALSPEMRKTFVKVVGYDQSALLSHIKNPTLLIWGDRDTETPLWMGQQMEKEIADSGLVVLEGGTHFAYLEQATRFQTIVRQFLLN